MSANYKREINYLDRAIKSGETAYKKLTKVRDELSSASRWGILDTVKGKWFTTFVKQRKIKEAGKISDEAVLAINAFERELANVSNHTTLKIKMSKPAVLADYFLDSTIVDVIVQMQIRKNRKNVERTMKQIQGILAELRDEKAILRRMQRGEVFEKEI